MSERGHTLSGQRRWKIGLMQESHESTSQADPVVVFFDKAVELSELSGCAVGLYAPRSGLLLRRT